MKTLIASLTFFFASSFVLAQSPTGCTHVESKGVFANSFKNATLYVNSTGSVPVSLTINLQNGTALKYPSVHAIAGKEDYKWGADESSGKYPLNIYKTYPIQGGNVYDFTVKVYDITDKKNPALTINCRYAFYRM